MAAEGEIYLEFRVSGKAVEVAAIDAQTAVEVTFMAPANTSESELARLARQKLNYVQSKNQDKPEPSGKRPPDRRGIIV